MFLILFIYFYIYIYIYIYTASFFVSYKLDRGFVVKIDRTYLIIFRGWSIFTTYILKTQNSKFKNSTAAAVEF